MEEMGVSELYEKKQREYQDALAGFDQVTYLERQITTLQRDLAAAQALLARRETSWTESQAQRDRLVSKLTAERDAAQAQIRELTASLDTMTRKMQRCSDERDAAQALVAELESSYLYLDQDYTKLRTAFEAARSEARALRGVVENIQAICDSRNLNHVAVRAEIAQCAFDALEAAATPEPAPPSDARGGASDA